MQKTVLVSMNNVIAWKIEKLHEKMKSKVAYSKDTSGCNMILMYLS